MKRKFTTSNSEIITITVLFHLSDVRTFKHFYLGYVQKHLQEEFPNTVWYNRFVKLMQRNMLPLTLYMKTCCLGQCTGISFIDSTPLRACKTNVSLKTRYLRILPPWANPPWAGFMDLSSILWQTIRANYLISLSLKRM